MPKRAVFLDDSVDLQKLMSLLLKAKLDIDCLCFSSLDEMQAQREEVLSRDLAILDINLGPNIPNGLDAYHWLMECRFKGKVVMLTGHARSSPLVAAALKTGLEVFEKPLKTEALLRAIRFEQELSK